MVVGRRMNSFPLSLTIVIAARDRRATQSVAGPALPPGSGSVRAKLNMMRKARRNCNDSGDFCLARSEDVFASLARAAGV
ncbi:MAG: hypothetical protein DMG30_03990 [Acidobacteria bacterium]|nr:MAG: hypothetical protein DMG30_03990 [Acidobacteriota bacterium]